jgi:hypothetical protein
VSECEWWAGWGSCGRRRAEMKSTRIKLSNCIKAAGQMMQLLLLLLFIAGNSLSYY